MKETIKKMNYKKPLLPDIYLEGIDTHLSMKKIRIRSRYPQCKLFRPQSNRKGKFHLPS